MYADDTTLYCNINQKITAETIIGYEPAGFTVHLPPKMIEGGFIFSHGGLVPSKFFPKKEDFVGDIKTYSL